MSALVATIDCITRAEWPGAAEHPREGEWMTELKLLEDRAFTTYKARLKAAERLHMLDNFWNAALIASAVSGAVSAIGSVVDGSMYGDAGPALLAVATVIVLVVSLVVSAQSFGARSRNMFISYRRAQRIALAAESLRLSGRRSSDKRVARLLHAYNTLLDESENHTEADYQRATMPGRPTWAKFREGALVAAPLFFLSLPVLTVAPFAAWAMRAAIG
jgi:hypothetical protein